MTKSYRIVAIDKHGREHSPFKSTLPFSVAIRALWRWKPQANAARYSLHIKPV